jgi:glucan phosphoethanolaminetransferase (alkaline phosphatase superfamily)
MDSLWKEYNSESSWLPFLAPLTIWIATLVYTILPSTTPRPKWGEWTFVHQLHNLIIIIGWLSLYYNDDEIFNERIGIMWSLSYFIVDLINCVCRFDGPYSLHAVLCITLGVANYTTPVLRTLRMNSRAAQCELSTPFLFVSRKTRKPLHFVMFALTFTLCRVVLIPVALINPVRKHGIEWSHWIMLSLLAFYGLNCFWYTKILSILINGGKKVGKPEKKDE